MRSSLARRLIPGLQQRHRKPTTILGGTMRPAGIIGVLLIVFGAIVLVLRGVSYVKDRDKADLGIATITTERRGFIPPWVGGGGGLAGGGLPFRGRRLGAPPVCLRRAVGGAGRGGGRVLPSRGGFSPAVVLYSIQGDTGAGKTTLCLQ